MKITMRYHKNTGSFTVDPKGRNTLNLETLKKAVIIFSPMLHLASKVSAEQIKSHQ